MGSASTLDAFIVDAVRTPMGRYRGVLAGVRPDDLAAHAIAKAVERTGIDPAAVCDVYLGAANQAGEDNRDAARMAALLAGLPVDVPGVTVNRLCASGLEAVNQASRALRLGEGDLYLAGGAESMSRAPWVVPKPEAGLPRGPQTMHDTSLGWRLINPRMAERYSTESMGETGENVAERYGVGREEQDRFALQSHTRALGATRDGRFADEMVPIEAPSPDGRDAPVVVDVDEGPRADTSLEKLSRLRPAFRDGGTVTAGNASTLNDGAACLVLATGQRAEALGARPLARIVSIGVAGVDPAYMGMGPVPAIRRALDGGGLSLGDIDLIEINEAFASQVLACAGELGIEEERLNVNGGAIALGHPLGCSGARLLTTLVWELRRRGARYGIAALCVGVGQGVATIIENPDAA
ncbi:MAG: beta-ketoadipyl CoA thiolase [Actinobacteria bacterium 13_1_20CM_3_68_9]|nr:MAG: beta-ketoadipyl CoA thiolase [Actinobacteria bacterium 13_1_20CM_3_68_9]